MHDDHMQRIQNITCNVFTLRRPPKSSDPFPRRMPRGAEEDAARGAAEDEEQKR
jgi:hypothetical protein